MCLSDIVIKFWTCNVIQWENPIPLDNQKPRSSLWIQTSELTSIKAIKGERNHYREQMCLSFPSDELIRTYLLLSDCCFRSKSSCITVARVTHIGWQNVLLGKKIRPAISKVWTEDSLKGSLCWRNMKAESYASFSEKVLIFHCWDNVRWVWYRGDWQSELNANTNYCK